MHNNLAQFRVHKFSAGYCGYGSGSSCWPQYFVFDLKLGSRIYTRDIILPGKVDKFNAVARDAYRSKLRKETKLSSREINEIVENFDLLYEMSTEGENLDEWATVDSFYFDKKGLVFFKSGLLDSSLFMYRGALEIPYSKLKGVIRPEYLPK